MAKNKPPMTLAQALTEVKKEYERAMKLDYIVDPLAYALYQVWKKADGEGRRCGRSRKHDR